MCRSGTRMRSTSIRAAGGWANRRSDTAYRGIFVNDEAPSLTASVHEKDGNYNSLFYTKVFELLKVATLDEISEAAAAGWAV